MRNAFIVSAIIALLIEVAVLTYGPNGTLTQTSPANLAGTGPVPFTELAHGTLSTVSTRANYLITSSAELLALWAIIDAPGQTPTVDFTKNNVIAVFAGNEPAAGYSIKVSQIEDAQSRMVTVSLTKPGGSCLPAQPATSPYQVIELPKTTLPLAHEDTTVTTSCL